MYCLKLSPVYLIVIHLLLHSISIRAENNPLLLHNTQIDHSHFEARQAALNRRASDIDDRDRRARHDCYSRFFVNHCLDRVRAHTRAERSALRADQLTLDQAQRAAHVQQRKQKKAQQHAQEEAQAPERAQEAQRNRLRFEEKLRAQKQAQRERAQAAQQRAENVARYQEKQRAAEAYKSKRQNQEAKD